MTTIRNELIFIALNRANALIDYDICNDAHKINEFQKQMLLSDNSLTNDEKIEAIRKANKMYDRNKVLLNSGKKRICENCNQKCLATSYCECCIQNYLKSKFLNWTSGNNDIDNLLQKCQIESLTPEMIIEWIPYNNLQNIEYLTKGGFSEIYTADWINGKYVEWDSKECQLKRFGKHQVILKGLGSVESVNQSWFEEAKSHLTISNKWPQIVPCFGITHNPLNGNYMLVMSKRNADLRKYLQQTQNQLTWKERIKIIYNITVALNAIHEEKAIHRDLHSGNVLYSQTNQRWYISDLGFCGPAEKSLTSIYGNLPYIAPEVITGKQPTKESDIYSIAILMWEISSGQPPFDICEHDYYLAMNIINGIRPKIVSGTPLKYENLMKQCWDADSSKRPDLSTIIDEIFKLHHSYHQNTSNETSQPKTNNNLQVKTGQSYATSKLFTSKIHQFENLPEPKNATEEEQEAFHSKLYNFSIPDNIEDLNNSNYTGTSKAISISEDDSEKLSKALKKLQINPDDDNENDYEEEIMEQNQIKINVDDTFL
ncbi:kinase-like domain-containing protein [Glomus cerebriforme]|uniref:Kinase-like domain-containing protein n=1 Tax=Glomus cerebriforme TaxID=658196 RepID=A0A397TJJ9_9GLOM|nr:kinase-like domain-containing protein [Glomus cerebriforme]